MRRASPAAVLLLLVGAACRGDAPGATTSGATRDSAGIEIVENAAPRWSETDAWRLSDDPVLTMGGTEGDSAHEFFRVTGAVRLSDGTIVVANGGTYELRFYAADGALLRSAGRKGDGPGEFEALTGLSRAPGDTLVTQDLMHRRISLFDAAGRHVRDVPIPAPTPFAFLRIAGRSTDGNYLAFMQTGTGPFMMNRPVGPPRDSVQVLRLDGAGAVTDTLGTFPDRRVEVRNLEMMGREMPVPVPVPFSPHTTVVAGSDLAYIGTGDAYEIAALDPGGAIRRLIRKAHRPRLVTDADRARHRESLARMSERLLANPGLKPMQEAMAQVGYPEVMPAYGFVVLDSDDHAWVAEYFMESDQPLRWSVFDPAGQFLGVVETPLGLFVRDIGSDYVLGQISDEMEVERVVLYRLIKPAG